MHSNHRREPFKRSDQLERTLSKLEEMLASAERERAPRVPGGDFPIVLIMGCARSGSTLLHQFLAQTGEFAYPTNLMSRFYHSTYIGSLIQQALGDFDVRGEVFGARCNEGTFRSVLGKTRGPWAPNEFWYFWRRFFQFTSSQQLGPSELAAVDDEFQQELYRICHVFRAPLVMKGMILNWNIPYLYRTIDRCYFIHIRRDVTFNAQSLLKAREEFFGNRDRWYSFRPPELEDVSGMCPEEQVVRQVVLTNEAIERGLSEIPPDRYMRLDYEDFCKDPDAALHDLQRLIKYEPCRSTGLSFECADEVSIDQDSWNRLTAEFATHSSRASD